MRFLSLALPALFILITACDGETPGQVVSKFFTAYENADGNALINCMSREALRDINEYLDQLRETPEESAEYLTMTGMEVTAEALENMTAGDFVNTLFNSPAYADQLPDLSSAEFGKAAIYGDRALVPVTMDGNTEEIELVLEDGNWKIVGDGMEIL